MNDQNPGNTKPQRQPTGQLWVGLIVLFVGCALLLDKLDFWIFPGWIFSWPMILIAVGIVVGARKNFTGPGWLILVLLGTFFLLDDITDYHWHLYHYGLPVGIIVLGLFLLVRGVSGSRGTYTDYRKNYSDPEAPRTDAGIFESQKKSREYDGEDFLNLTTILGSIKKRVYSKDFKGGDTFTMFGGTELDFSQADIKGRVVLDITQIFGGVTLIVPANWAVKSDLTAILGGIDDKRRSAPTGEHPEKLLVISGACIFGGVEIKSY